MGAEIVPAVGSPATDYSGDLNIDDKILARVVDAYRRVRNTLQFLLANRGDFDPATDAVPARRAAGDRPLRAEPARPQLQATSWQHYAVYEFHPVVAKLQVYCSGRPGRVLPGCAEGPPLHHGARQRWRGAARKPRCAQIAHAMLRWMAPFLSFTAEEASGRCWVARPARRRRPAAGGRSFIDAYMTPRWTRPTARCWPDGAALAELRDAVDKEIEALRTSRAGGRGAAGRR